MTDDNSGLDRSDSIEDVRIDPAIIRTLANDAAAALVGLWDSPRGSFWRSTEHRALERTSAPGSMFPTVTFRSIEALLRLVEDYPGWADAASIEVLDKAISTILTKKEEELQSTLGLKSEGAILNPFSLALYVDCLSRIVACKRATKEQGQSASEKLLQACNHLLSYTTLQNTPQVGSDVHPFVLFHLIRAIEAASVQLTDTTLRGRLGTFGNTLIAIVRKQVMQLLAQDSLGVMNPSEGVALAFCGAALSIYQEPEEMPFVNAALRVAFKFQDTSGCWPLGRIVPENKDIEVKRELQIPTYEIAWGLTEAVLTMIESRGESLQNGSRNSVDSLVRAMNYTAASTVQLDAGATPRRGWCSEHAFGKPIIESWTSATVLQSVLSFYELSEAVDRQLILRRFTSASPKDPDWPEWQRWARYRSDSEPEHDVRILDYLDRVIVRSILVSPGRLPRSTEKNVSILLFGPPGTSKTTIVKALADGLSWPIVSLSPGNFIERGLEYIEAQAKRVFEMLLRLSHVIVLFDECDELFRDRKPVPGTDQVRNITAFVTASMLPKLQDVHDRGRIVFAICTNHVESMDPAIKRGGRIDHLIGVAPPDRVARRKIIEQDLQQMIALAHVRDGIDELASHTERFTRGEVDRASRLFARAYTSIEEAKANAKAVADVMKPSLTISVKEYEDFERLKREYSHPHLEKGLK